MARQKAMQEKGEVCDGRKTTVEERTRLLPPPTGDQMAELILCASKNDEVREMFQLKLIGRLREKIIKKVIDNYRKLEYSNYCK